ncbi:MAG: hypothetical protein KIS66_12710 [Fimbriimonadaceae bacterium]|nr:hypothetical protein [Fimbriimonadaceae bacterium]
MPNLLAQLSLSEDVIMSFVAAGLFVVLPLVAILLNHQRKMAELFHRRDRDSGAETARIARLEQEVAQVRQQVNELVIRQDDSMVRMRRMPAIGDETKVQQRLEE